jgi:hypothetical protein
LNSQALASPSQKLSAEGRALVADFRDGEYLTTPRKLNHAGAFSSPSGAL